MYLSSIGQVGHFEASVRTAVLQPSQISPLCPPTLPVQSIVDPHWTSGAPAQPWNVDYLAPPRTSKPISPPRLVKLSAPPGSTRLPHPCGTALVNCLFAFAMDFRAFVCDSSLHPFGSVGLRFPPASPQSSCILVSPRPFVPAALPWSPGPSLSLGLIGTSAPPGSPPSTALSQSVVPLVSPAKPKPPSSTTGSPGDFMQGGSACNFT